VAVIEAAPSVLHDVAAVEREVDRALAGFVERGPAEAELASAKEQLRARLQAAQARAGAGVGGEAREVALARVARLAAAADRLGGEELRAFVQRAFVRERRVVVITAPRR
jgi:hypothetical protein